MLGYSADQVRAAEAPHLAAGAPLMALAAAGLAAEIRRVLAESPGRHGAGRVLLLVGSGNNGGDALYAGAELAADGVAVTILATAERMHEGGCAAAVAAGAEIEPDDAATRERVEELAAGADVVVDGILGTGTSAHPALRGRARELVSAIKPIADAPGGPLVVAVDIPSGIDPNDGSVPDPLVLAADVTVTFGGVKAGLLLPPASGLAGTVRLIDIGLGSDLAKVEPLVRTPE